MAQVAISRLRFEVASVLEPPWKALRAGGGLRALPVTILRTFPLSLACTAIIGLFALVQHTHGGWWFVEHIAGVYQALPLPLILLRLPLSMFAPAPDLPAWGAMAQVLIVFGFSEVHLGRIKTLVVAVCVNGLTTVSARIMVIIGLHWGIGTPQVDQYELDTGPSTVVVALAVYVALMRHAYVLLAITIAAMAGEVVLLPNLAGREHLVAIALGATACLIGERVLPRSRTRHDAALSPPTLKRAARRTSVPTSVPTASTPRPHAPGATPRRPASRP